MSGEFANAGAIKASIDFDAAGLEAAVKKAMNRATDQVTDQIDQSMQEVEGRITRGFKGVGAGLLGYLGIGSIADAVGQIGGYILGVGRDSEKALNMFRAVSGATAAEMEKVAEKAQALGSDAALAGVSAGDAALAMTELAKSGFSVEEAMSASTGVLQLATAAQVDAGTAAQIAASQIQAFGLEASDAQGVADLLANAANMTAADMQGMADSLNQVGAVANASGLSLAETAGVVAIMADNAIVGSDAGTSLKSMLIALQAPSGEAASLMAKYGINVYDSAGNMKGLAGITKEVIDGTKNLTQEKRQEALATIFGADAIRAVNVLMAEGADGVRELTKGIQTKGAAAKLADANTQGLTGAIDALRNVADGLAGDIYSTVAPALEDKLRGVLKDLPGLIDTTAAYLNEMGDNLEPLVEIVGMFFEAFQPVLVIAAKAAFAALLGVTQALSAILTPLAAVIEDNEGAFKALTTIVLSAVLAYKALSIASGSVRTAMASPAVAKARENFTRLRGSVVSANAAMMGLRATGAGMMAAMGGPWGLALAGATIAIGAFAAGQAETKAQVDALADSLDEQTGAVTENSRALVAKALADSGALAAAKRLGLNLDDVTDATLGNAEALERLRPEYEALVRQYEEGIGGQTLEDFNTLRTAMADQIGVVKEGKKEHELMAEALGEITFSAEAAKHVIGTSAVEFRRGGVASGEYARAIAQGKVSVDKMGDAATATRIAVEGLNNQFVTGINEEIQFEQAIDDAAAKIRKLGRNALNASGQFDLNGQAGRDLASALATVATEADGVTGGVNRARNQMIRMVRPLVENREAAARLVDQFFQTRVEVDKSGNAASGAAGKFNRLDGAVGSLKGDKVSIPVETPGLDSTLWKINNFMARVREANGTAVSVPFISRGGMIRRASGGPVYGPGTGTSDEVAMAASHGEHVITASEVKAAGGHGNIMRLRQMLTTGSVPVEPGGSGALVENLDVSVGDRRDLGPALDEVTFRLRQIRRGGKYDTP